jgi:hypothetical protein
MFFVAQVAMAWLAIGEPLVELDVRTLYLKDLSVLGCTVFEPHVFSNLVRHIA